MDRTEFENTYVRPGELRELFPFWSDSTFKAYTTRKALPIEQIKIGGRYYCRRADVEEYKARTKNGTCFNVYVGNALRKTKTTKTPEQ